MCDVTPIGEDRSARLSPGRAPVRPWGVLLRMLRPTPDGRLSPLARLVAVLLLVGLAGLNAPVLVRLAAWIMGLL
jgi:hypothetical protein